MAGSGTNCISMLTVEKNEYKIGNNMEAWPIQKKRISKAGKVSTKCPSNFLFSTHLFFFHLACNMHIIFPLTALSLDTVYATENFVDENVLKKNPWS